MINFVCCKLFIITEERLRILQEHIYTDILTGQVIYIPEFEKRLCCTKYPGNQGCLITTGGGGVSCLTWYGIHIEKSLENIVFYAKGHSPSFGI